MTLLKLKRNWFGPNGVRYKARDGLVEVPKEIADLAPSDAVRYDTDASLPTRSLEPLPGFGAKPLNELNMDLIPGAAPTKVMTSVGRNSPADPNDPEEQERLKKAAAAEELLRGTDTKAEEKKAADETAAIEAGIKVVEELQEKQAEANDPVQAAANKDAGKTAKPVADKK